jgi:hypothetical protein
MALQLADIAKPRGKLRRTQGQIPGQLKKLHWWANDQGHPIPSGLVLTYDGARPAIAHPP